MSKRHIKLISLLLALLMMFSVVLTACGSGKDTTAATTTEDKSTNSEEPSTNGTTASEEPNETTVGTTTEPDVTTKEPQTTAVPIEANPAYKDYTGFGTEAVRVGAAHKVLRDVENIYRNYQLKYFISDTYTADLSKYTEIEKSSLTANKKTLLAVWDVKVNGDFASAYLSKIDLGFETEFKNYVTPQGRDFIVNYKMKAPLTIYANITKAKSTFFTVDENTPFVATQSTGKDGIVSNRLKIKYVFDNPGEYYVNYFYRADTGDTSEFVFEYIKSVPLTITTNTKYVDSALKGYILNIDGSMTAQAVDKFEAGFYNKFPMMYYAFNDLLGLPPQKHIPKTIYIRVIAKSTDDPIGYKASENIAYVWIRPDTVYFKTETASANDAEDTLVHELTHIFEKGFKDTPGFFTEGLAEAVRYIYGGNKTSGWKPPNDKTNELESYNAGGFFVYITKTYADWFKNKYKNHPNGIDNILVELFRLSKNGWEGDKHWIALTGKKFDQLLAEYRASTFTMPTDYNNPNGNYVNFIKDIRVLIPDGYVFSK